MRCVSQGSAGLVVRMWSVYLLVFADVPATKSQHSNPDGDWWRRGPVHPLNPYCPVRNDGYNLGFLPDPGSFIQSLHDLVIFEDVEIHFVELNPLELMKFKR